jgi:hypothetical protein
MGRSQAAGEHIKAGIDFADVIRMFAGPVSRARIVGEIMVNDSIGRSVSSIAE